jgi:hypothetical protein
VQTDAAFITLEANGLILSATAFGKIGLEPFPQAKEFDLPCLSLPDPRVMLPA